MGVVALATWVWEVVRRFGWGDGEAGDSEGDIYETLRERERE